MINELKQDISNYTENHNKDRIKRNLKAMSPINIELIVLIINF